MHIKWSDTNSIGKLLGFTADDVLDLFNIASANRDQHYRFKGEPDVPPGSTIRYRPFHPLPCDAHVLRGGRTGSFTVRVTDNHGEPAILRETFSARIVISW